MPGKCDIHGAEYKARCPHCKEALKPYGLSVAEKGEDILAKKHDGGKAPVYQGFLNRFPRAIMGVAMISEYGFRKYGSYNGWERVPDGLNRYTDAKARHGLLQSIEGPYDDGDSGLAHAGQEAWNAMARYEILLQKGEVEIRSGNEIGQDGKPILGTAKKVL